MTSVPDDAELARLVAGDAAAVLVTMREEWASSGAGDPKALRDRADAAAHRLITDRLVAARPGDVVFSEEAPDPRRRLAASRVWIVDPLDGTREYAEPGRTDWAVHVALWADGDLVAGAVALPALGEVHATDAPPSRTAPVPADGPRVVVSRSRPPAWSGALAAQLGGGVVEMGSAGAKAAAVWRGEAEVYAHIGGLHEWDAAAPVVVARAAGLHVSRLDGAPLRFNHDEPYLEDLLVCLPELAGPVLDWVRSHWTEVTAR